MSERSPSINAEDNTPKAVKDKNCPYCGQAFTSSSLGRHLDLYIKERNPKKPDGIHNVEEIRKLRGGVTRRQPKGSARRRHTSTPAGTPLGLSRKGNDSDDEPCSPSPSVHDGASASAGTSAADIVSMFPLGVRWEATGVMNEVLVKSPDGGSGGNDSAGGEAPQSVADADLKGLNSSRRTMPSRAVSKQVARAQLDAKRKMQDALDDARAAELALREFANAWRAAKQHIELGSMPFDFDPLTMNFPALTLQCLRVQPTLFASTQLPTPSCWSTEPPGASQFEALKSFFKEEFRKWKVKCASATTALYEELKYPPPPSFNQVDRRQAVERAERRAEALEQEVSRHLEIAFAAWAELSRERQTELWTLELARGIASKQGQIDKLKEEETVLRQEVSNLKGQIEQLNRLQQPREYRLVPPAHIPMNEQILFELQDHAVSHGGSGVGLNINDRHSDLSTLVTTAISRWKKVIVTARSSSGVINAQRPLDAATGLSPLASSAGSGNLALPIPNPSTTPAAALLPSRRQSRKASRVSSRTAAHVPVVATPSAPVAPMEVTPQVEHPRPDQQPERRAGDGGGDESEEKDGDNGANNEAGGDDGMPDLQRPESDASEDEDVDGDEGDDDDGMSDKDADAEMEDGDEFAHMHTPISRNIPPSAGVSSSIQHPQPILQTPRQQQQQQQQQQMMPGLKVPRTRRTTQRPPSTNSSGSGGLVNGSRSMPDLNTTMHGHARGQHMARETDFGLAMPTLGNDAMYMD